MRIAYYSMTGNVRDFISWYLSDVDSVSITDWSIADEPYILVTPTYGFGKVPDDVEEWLDGNSEHMIGVISSGNRNWGENFGKAGDTISQQYGVPLLGKFELKGTPKEGEIIADKIRGMEAMECTTEQSSKTN